jgi:hypothetical protein
MARLLALRDADDTQNTRTKAHPPTSDNATRKSTSTSATGSADSLHFFAVCKFRLLPTPVEQIVAWESAFVCARYSRTKQVLCHEAQEVRMWTHFPHMNSRLSLRNYERPFTPQHFKLRLLKKIIKRFKGWMTAGDVYCRMGSASFKRAFRYLCMSISFQCQFCSVTQSLWMLNTAHPHVFNL